MADPPRPRLCWTEIGPLITAALALAAGLAFGAMYHRELLGDPLPWTAAVHAEAIDGDTVRVTLLLHVAGIDAPELDRGGRCPEEKDGAIRARDRLAELLQAQPVRVKVLGQDAYGRMTAEFIAANRPTREMLVREGLVQETEGTGRWCPNDASADPAGAARRMAASLGLR